MLFVFSNSLSSEWEEASMSEDSTLEDEHAWLARSVDAPIAEDD